MEENKESFEREGKTDEIRGNRNPHRYHRLCGRCTPGKFPELAQCRGDLRHSDGGGVPAAGDGQKIRRNANKTGTHGNSIRMCAHFLCS